MSGLVLVYTLFGSLEEARTVCRRLIAEKRAGCANIQSPCTSIYEWEGAVREEAEVPVLLKTTTANCAALRARLAELHSYEVPAILSWEADANDGYGDWIGDKVS